MKLLLSLACLSLVGLQLGNGYQVKPHDFDQHEVELLDRIGELAEEITRLERKSNGLTEIFEFRKT